MQKTVFSTLLLPTTYSWLALALASGVAVGQTVPPGRAQSAATQQVATYKFSGRVLDEKNSGLPGATVVLKNDARTGTTTDADGKFTISVPTGGATLVVSAIGYLAKELAITSETTLDVTMAPDTKLLNEVVVVGYGTQKKENLTGAVAAITIDDKIASRSLANVSSGLSGLIPGLSVQQSTGQAGRSGAALVIRGLGTVNNAGPLIVVDGLPDVDINRIDMNDVASISVLKDAASASVYGSRAANGVVLITTKNGSGNKKPLISYSGTYGLSQPTNFYNYFDDYARSLTMHLRASGAGASSTTFRYGTVEDWLSKSLIDPINYPSTNWWDVVLRDHGRIQTHNLSASGGNDRANFYLSAGMYDEQGILINHDFKRFNTRFNLDYKLSNQIKVGIRMDGQWSNQTYANSEGLITYTGTAGYDIRYAIPGILPQNPVTGQYGGAMAYGEDALAYNMLAAMNINHNLRDRQEINANLYGEWTPITGLTARVDYGLRYYNQFTKSYSDPTDVFNFQTNQISRTLVSSSAGISNAVNSGYKTLLQGRLTYNRTLFGNHQLTLLGAYTEEYWFNRNLSASRLERINPLLSEIDAALTTTQAAGGNSDAEGLRSGIGRLNYVINDKYLFEVNARYDGSSKFLPGFQYGFFPSASVGWRFSEEPFFKPFSAVVSSAKIRASIGKLGNNSGVGRYEQRDIFNLTNYILNGKIAKGFSSSKIINEDFSWEETNVTNVGLDLAFFGGKLTTDIDFYNKLTSGMIRPSSLSTFLSGYNAPRVNIGKLSNTGLEVNVTYRAKVRDANVGATLNMAWNKNKLLEWNEFLSKGFTYLNLPYHFVYTRVATGIAQSWEDIANAPYQGQYVSPGDVLYKDLNGDGQINDEDRIAQPKFNRDQPLGTYGLNLFGNWRGFDVSVLWQGATGRKDFWLEPFNQVNIPSARNAFQDFLWNDTWTLDNRSASLPRLLTGSGGNNQAESSFWLDDFSYLRLKNIQVGYNIPLKYTSRVGVSKLRIYGTAENLLTYTKYRGVDPEKSTSVSGADNNDDPFPLLKSFSVGLNLSF
ncbi:SusC/RagA family TonB-linked outer membrane protein [Fibrella forsythiae]|uniref:TonB-dependent receptor n=1 Tax=Fibrella forsythiae TaxID=2817061 RepID=A0ABS3JGJ8_9BACT|nr:TonB-dependent receptor [Fibrella forsythiae]MBO0948017.1 TonB-dependent receptor [Fibrella forsythiae]